MMSFFIFVFLSFMCFLQIEILKVGIYLVINGIPIMLCFISLIWKVCLKGFVKSLFCSFVRVGIRYKWILPKLVKHDPCAVANLLDVFEGINFGCKVCMPFQVRIFIIFDFAPEFTKKSFSRSGEKKWYCLNFLFE